MKNCIYLPINYLDTIKRTEPENALAWEWYTYDEAMLLPLIPMIKMPLDIIFTEIKRYFENCNCEEYLDQEYTNSDRKNTVMKK